LTVVLEKAPPCTPINLGSGRPVTIKEAAETIASHLSVPPRIDWDTEKPSGDPVRMMDMERARELIGFESRISFRDAVIETIEWYVSNRGAACGKGARFYGKR
jgi:GDP-L-fucose synthase